MSLSTNIMGGEHTYQFIIGNTKIPLFYMPFENPNIMRLSDKKEYDRTQTIGGQVFEHWGEQPQVMHIEMKIRKNSSAGNLIGVYDDKRYDLEDPMVCTELELLKMLYHLDRRKLKYNFSDVLKKPLHPYSGKTNGKTSLLSLSTGSMGAIATSSISKGNIINSADFYNITSASNITPGKSSGVWSKVTDYIGRLSDTIIIYKLNIYSGFFMNLEITDSGEMPFINDVSFDFLVTKKMSDSVYNLIADSTLGRGISSVLGASTAITAFGYLTDSLSSGTQSLVDGLF